jgi:UDPglucose 6-dehydrogenase
VRIAVIGMGYVGLTTAAVLARQGHATTCTDLSERKVVDVNRGVLPFYEPGLVDLIRPVIEAGRLVGSVDNVEAARHAEVTFICVGTPARPDGSADLTAVTAAAHDIGRGLTEAAEYRVVVAKSTIPPGTTMNVILPALEQAAQKRVGADFGLCMNPEFLQEGSAVQNSLHPDRIVIGEYDARSGDVLDRLYAGFACPKLRCDLTAAELMKYAANAFLATKISFANEFARIAEAFHVDVYEVMRGVGLDDRINPRFLDAGVGFGGSCFPKDVHAIATLAHRHAVETPILDAVLSTNDVQPRHCVELVQHALGDLEGKVIAVLGLAFKPDTDDVRYTRALPIIEQLVAAGAHVRAYDPLATPNFQQLTDAPVEYAASWEEALRDADLAVVQTSWPEIQGITATDFKRLMKTPIIIDGRRTYPPSTMIAQGIQYYGIGWKNQ